LVGLVGGGCLAAQPLTVVSAASFERDGPLAPEMIVTCFSAAITAPLTQAGSTLPDTLAGYSITVGSTRAPLYSVTNGQISFVVPAGAMPGEATVTLRNQDRVLASANVRIAAVAPGLFTANNSGSGAPAALSLVIDDAGNRTIGELFQSAIGGGFLPRTLSPDGGEVYLMLFGTGIRNWRGEVTAAIGGTRIPVTAALAEGGFPGLDQVNLGPLPSDIPDRRGELDLAITADGAAANRVAIALNTPEPGEWGTRAVDRCQLGNGGR
jgi:uncharacterized protein (TIGR03437 family)